MSDQASSDALAAVVEPVLDALGLRCYDVELTGAAGRARTLRVLVERADGSAADLDEITAATEALSPALDADRTADRILRGSYTLEVSSPGLERPLRRPDHWQGAIGELVSVKTRIDGVSTRVRGTVTSVDDDGAVLDVDGTAHTIRFADVTQARTVFEWGPQPKPGRSRAERRKRGRRDEREKVTP